MEGGAGPEGMPGDQAASSTCIFNAGYGFREGQVDKVWATRKVVPAEGEQEAAWALPHCRFSGAARWASVNVDAS